MALVKARISVSRLQPALLDWFRRNQRRLPWRTRRDPYRVWVSEVMLQQTTVKTATPYFEAFVARFPTVAALAAANEEEVLAAWSGLGYYHRARNLHRAAQHLLRHHDGHFPRTLEAALAVPGVGLYTASAVLSIAHGVPLPVVDGNVRRVLARLFALRGPEWANDGPYYNRAEELLFRESPGDWNQALMELGATVCTPRKPLCPACPLRETCQAYALSLQDQLPEARARRAPVEVVVAAAVLERDGRVLLVRRREGALLGRFWEVPQTSLESLAPLDLERELRDAHGLFVKRGALLGRARHAITFRRIRMEAYGARLRREPPNDPDRFLWAAPADLSRLPVSSLTRKIIRAAARGQLPLAGL
jgi:A/G-specific adenine glycosylase